MNYPSKLDEWKKFEKNNPTIAINILYTKEKYTLPAYISKHLTQPVKKQSILLMITSEEKEGCHYLTIKKISALLHKKLPHIKVIFII